MLSSPFRIVFFGVFLCVCVCVCVLAISRLSAHAGFDLHLSFNSVRGFGAGGDDVYAAATCVFFFFC